MVEYEILPHDGSKPLRPTQTWLHKNDKGETVWYVRGPDGTRAYSIAVLQTDGKLCFVGGVGEGTGLVLVNNVEGEHGRVFQTAIRSQESTT